MSLNGVNFSSFLTEFQDGGAHLKPDWAERGANWCLRPLRMSWGQIEGQETVKKTMRVAYAVLALLSFPFIGIGLGLALWSKTYRFKAFLLQASQHEHQKSFAKMEQCAQKAKDLFPDEPHGQEALGKAFLGQKKYPEAHNQCKSVLKNDDKCVDALELQAEVYFQESEGGKNKELLKKGLECVNRALKLQPESDTLMFKKGEFTLSLHEYPKGLDHLNKALELNPHNQDALRRRTEAFLLVDEWEKGIKDASQYLQKHPLHRRVLAIRSECYRRLGKHNLAFEDIDTSIERGVDDDHAPVDYWIRGILHKHFGRLHQASADFEQTLRLKPDYGYYFIRRGAKFCLNGEFEKAVEEINYALALEPKRSEFLVKRAVVYRLSGEFARAFEDLTSALQQNPKDPIALLQMGYYYKIDGDDENALEYFSKSIKEKNTPDANIAEASILLKSPNTRKLAIANLNKVLLQDPKNVTALFTRIDAYEIEWHFDSVIVDATQILQIIPDNYTALWKRGNAYFKVFDFQAAYADYQAILKLNPPEASRVQVIQAIENVKKWVKPQQPH